MAPLRSLERGRPICNFWVHPTIEDLTVLRDTYTDKLGGEQGGQILPVSKLGPNVDIKHPIPHAAIRNRKEMRPNQHDCHEPEVVQS